MSEKNIVVFFFFIDVKMRDHSRVHTFMVYESNKF